MAWCLIKHRDNFTLHCTVKGKIKITHREATQFALSQGVEMLKINDIQKELVASLFRTKVTQQFVDLSVYISTEQTVEN
jgi:hypothetical protein